jgi:prephenate dehydratase
MKLALSGDRGSFSEEAALIYAQRVGVESELIYSIDMESVLTALDEGRADTGIFPVVNSRGGLVHPAFHAMGAHTFRMVDELWMEVRQCLMVRPGISKSDIVEVATHSQALAQCDRYLKRELPQAKLTEWDDTAKAARDLSLGVFGESTAVIAPARSAQIYGLTLLESGIEDQHPNLTTFIIVKSI